MKLAIEDMSVETIETYLKKRKKEENTEWVDVSDEIEAKWDYHATQGSVYLYHNGERIAEINNAGLCVESSNYRFKEPLTSIHSHNWKVLKHI